MMSPCWAGHWSCDVSRFTCRPEGGCTDSYELICYDCGDDPDMDYRDISPDFQRIRGPCRLSACIEAYGQHDRLQHGQSPIPAALLTAGRYAADNVQISELVDQGHHLGGFWVGISQLPRSHPWTVRRIWRLHLFGPVDTVDQAHRSQPVA